MDATPEIPIPHIDPALYAWQPHPTSRLYLRRALGLETKWARREVKNRQLFLSGIVTLKTPLNSVYELYAAVTHTWVRLRFEFPEVVLKFGGDWVDGDAIMQCQIPRSDEEASDWVRRTLWLGGNIIEADSRLSAERQMRKHDINDPFCLQLIPTISQDADSDKILGSAFSFRVDHQLADGMGVYILAGNFFRILAEEVTTKESEQIDWEKAAKNIPKPWVQMMNEKQKTEGEDFENKVKKNADLIVESVKGEWGLTIRPGEEYTPKSIRRIFSIKQTKAILRSVKSEIGRAATVTHLGHAAMAMTLLSIKPAKDRPLTCDKFVCPLFMSGRRYLDPEQPKSKNYVPMCRAIGAIEFRNVDRYRLLETDGRDEVRRKLKMACEEARRSYQVIRERESILTESFTVAEYMGTATNVIKGKGTIDPLFLSDGIIEQYISRSYADIRGNNTLTVDDVRFTANPDGPPIIIRMYTFRDVIRIGAEWNGAWYDDADVQRFLDSITDLMLSLT